MTRELDSVNEVPADSTRQGPWGSDAQLRTMSHVEPARKMRAPGFDWEHEIRVALPPSYPDTDRQYPVLWVTDNNLEIALWTADRLWAWGRHVPELIIVAVGSDQTVPFQEWEMRRLYEFTSTDAFYFPGPTGDSVRQRYAAILPGWQESTGTGGAGGFLDFLVNDVRSALSSEYRMDPHDHALIGTAGAGLFAGFALFTRPEAFSRYILGSPSLNIGSHRVFELEEEYAAKYDDLPARVFLGAGEAEMTEDFISAMGCLGAMVRLVETLTVRNYPSLRLTAKIISGASHLMAVAPAYDLGMRAVWTDWAADESRSVAKGDST